MDELQHHGIKGQKWGVRRFQTADGRLTTAGKQRASENKKRTDAKTRGTLTNAQLKQKSRDFNWRSSSGSSRMRR